MRWLRLILSFTLFVDWIEPSHSFRLLSRRCQHSAIVSAEGLAEAMPTDVPLVLSRACHLGANEKGKIRLILASTSPRRREILNMMGLQGKFEVIASPLDESALQVQLRGGQPNGVLEGLEVLSDPKDYTRVLAEHKAKALVDQMASDGLLRQPTLVLGSDTIVELDGAILEKPRDIEDAKQMLRRLSGNSHAVHTGVALYRFLPSASDASELERVVLVGSFTESAIVRFAALSDSDIDAYIETGEPFGKAGSYGIQGIGGQFVHSVEGDFFAVGG
jgi:septum formation protein